MKRIITLTSLLISLNSLAQEPIIDRNVGQERIEAEDKGVRVKTYFHLGTNLPLEQADSLATKLNLGSFGYGFNLSFINSKRYSLVSDIYYGFDSYNIMQEEKNLLGNGFIYDSQQIRTNSARITLKNRIHLSKRGIENGVYIDLGAGASYVFNSKMIIRDEIDPNAAGNQGAEKTELILKKLNFIERLGYQAQFGIGRNGVALFGQYRLSNLFKSFDSVNNGNSLPEISPILIGLKLEI
jgi:hypothetical protein